ncbi:COG4223 family protein [Pseudotabrizicola sp.]|uniref:COG4223 family protein n=1 Tax=Pseudotabrizicola sp. TaxID=2939647 RepID=UPI00271590A5|nr:hypothetical protein [Pseudotabrizicola sp.]MDO8882805.1 hypothetical protein [Pseudotabrizicola sp.]
MAKRPPSKPTSEVDAVKSSDLMEAEATPVVDPIAMEEPPRPELQPDPDAPPPLVIEEPPSTQPDAVSEPEPALPPPPNAPPPQESKSGSGFVGTALGGVVAAAAGYALAIFVPFPGMGVSDAPTYASQAEVQALTDRINTLEATPAPDASLAERVTALESLSVQEPTPELDLQPLTEALTALETRITNLEARGPTGSTDEPSADLLATLGELQAEIAEMRATGADANAGLEALTAQTEARLAEAEAQAAALREEAEATARRAVSAAALGRVQAAIESGAPFAGALADMPGVAVPPALADLAETGVPSRAAVEDAFPPAARAALEASLRADMGEGWSDRLATFLQTTTGARSLTPRDGADPDAVLSRAEAAVRSGELAQALAELQGLPPEGQAEMASWSEMAQKRLDAVAAAAALSAAVEG